MTLKNDFAVSFLVSMVFVATVPVAAGQDWPQFRGPSRDGAVSAFDVPDAWPEGLSEQWKIDVGLGYATPVIVGDRLQLST